MTDLRSEGFNGLHDLASDQTRRFSCAVTGGVAVWRSLGRTAATYSRSLLVRHGQCVETSANMEILK